VRDDRLPSDTGLSRPVVGKVGGSRPAAKWGLTLICAIALLATAIATGRAEETRRHELASDALRSPSGRELEKATRCPQVHRKGKPPQRMCVSGRWYRSTSAWNTAIPPHPPIAPRSSSLISAFNNKWCKASACVGPTMVSVPTVWLASRATKLSTVQINYPTCNARRVRAPIPAQAIPEGPPEGGMVVMVRETGVEWDFFKLTQPGAKPLSSGPVCSESSNWAATVVTRADPGWTGSGTLKASPRGSGTLFGSGLIRPRDTQQPAASAWDHAVALAYPGTLAGAYARPATHSDGTCTDAQACIPMGARIQLDPAVRCGQWPDLEVWQRQLCRTLQKYGMIVVDTGSALLVQNPRSVGRYVYPWAPAWRTVPAELSTHLRVIDWTKWTGSH
jgi:hypothetical protein